MKDQDLIKAIIAETHGGNKLIVETSDFIQGVKAAIKYIRKKKIELTTKQ